MKLAALVSTLLVTVMLGGTPARAAVDIGGPWYVAMSLDFGGAPGPEHFPECQWDLVQADTTLTGTFSCSSLSLCLFGCKGGGGRIDGSLTGTIDPDAGTFLLAISPDIFTCSSHTGSVASDGLSFSGTISCSDPLTATFTGTRCGNGVVDAGEACDPGLGDDPCCTAICQPTVEGSACGPDDGDDNACTGSYCDGAGTCAGPGNVPAGRVCQTIEGGCAGRTCDGAGSCVGPTVETDPSGSPCGGDCFTEQGTCAAGVCSAGRKPAGSRCNLFTGDVCAVDSCDGNGVCEPGPCSPCCADVGGSCVPAYDATCEHTTVPASKVKFTLNRSTMNWQWRGGDEIDFNDPVANGAAICTYDGSGPAPSLAIASETATACGTTPCWKTGGTFTFRDSAGYSDGISRIKLKPGAGSAAKIAVKGRSAIYYGGLLPFDGPVRVQLKVGNRSWESTFSNPQVNDASVYRAKDGSPSAAFVD